MESPRSAAKALSCSASESTVAFALAIGRQHSLRLSGA
jgi:hypothetical protein